ncbi:MAG: alpha/beta hydrolase [Bacteroidales bacterium]|jgi:pimeloyl-ACP methyl ester carboxylesterase
MEKVIGYRNKRIVYNVTGAGKSVVLLHGFLENLHVWDGVLPYLSDNHRVIAIDLPGFGKSDVVNEIHSMELMADVVKIVLDTEQVASCLLIGHSMGGYVGAAFAEKFPEMLSGIVFFHSHAAPDNEDGIRNRNRTIEVVKKDKKNYIASFIPLMFAEENIVRYQNEITQLQIMALETSAEGVMAALAGMRDRNDQQPTLSALNVPVMFIIGKQDSWISIDKIIPQISLPQHSEILILEGVGHMGMIEESEKIMMALQSFVTRVSK